MNRNQTYPPRPKDQRIALVLQGGGALGAYQAGVYQALHEHGFCPDWVAGTSIGALNGAIIAGNQTNDPVARLREFWDTLSLGDGVWPASLLEDEARRAYSLGSALTSIMNGRPAFFTPRPAPLMADTAESASYYRTQPLHKLLEKLIDTDCLNNGKVRLSVGAVHVTDGQLTYFDSQQETLELEHIMASGALPPGFPAIRINNELYWDGAIHSNTPIEVVLDDMPRVDTLCFAVNLFPLQGYEPNNIPEVEARYKDLSYGSRIDQHIRNYEQLHDLRRKINALYQLLPESSQKDHTAREMAASGCTTTMQIIQLNYPCLPWELSTKDIDFSSSTLDERWQMGYEHTLAVLHQAPWKKPHDTNKGVVIHNFKSTEEKLEAL